MRHRYPWVPAVLLVVCAAALTWMWGFRDDDRQSNILQTVIWVSSSSILCFAWFVTLSSFSRRVRLLSLASVAMTIALGLTFIRVGGVTGDLVPIFTWRFSTPADAALEPSSPGSSTTTSQPVAVDVSWRDYPQFLGPDRNGTVAAIDTARDWNEKPPRLLWRQPIGAGWSGFAVSGDAAFTQEQRGAEEVVTCYALLTGELRWTHTDETRYETVIGGIGPRATPTVDGADVFAYGATGILNCIERNTGKSLWRRDTLKENGRDAPNEWGMSGSPLVHSDLVIVTVGGSPDRSLVAYDRSSGEPRWHAGNASGGYSSPLLTQLAGISQVIVVNHQSIDAHDAQTGAVLWSHPWPGKFPKVAQPVVVANDQVVVSSGYGVGCALLKIALQGDGLQVEELWKTRSLKAKYANFVQRDGFLYGLDDGILVCVDVATGKRHWKRGRYGHGQMILAGELLLVAGEHGDVALVEATPAGHRELTRFTAFDHKQWNSPALAAPYLLVRTDQEAACYELTSADS